MRAAALLRRLNKIDLFAECVLRFVQPDPTSPRLRFEKLTCHTLPRFACLPPSPLPLPLSLALPSASQQDPRRRSSPNRLLPDYTGPPRDLDAAKSYMKAKFVALNPRKERGLYVHLTCVRSGSLA